MRALMCLVLGLAACRAPSLDVSATPPIRLDPRLHELYAGEWHGTSYRPNDAIGTPWSLVQTISLDGTPVGQLTFLGTTIPPTAVKMLEATDSTFVSLIGPYYSPTLGREVVTRVEGKIDQSRMWGTFFARPVEGGDAQRGRFEAVRVDRKPT